MIDNKDCPCAGCKHKEKAIQETPCNKCADFGIIGYPEYSPTPGLLEPERFEL